MNRKLLLFAISALIISCGGRNVKPPVDLKRNNKTDTLVSNNIEPISVNSTVPLQPEDIINNEKSILEDNHIKNTNEVKTQKFYYELLNEFCKKYYARKFKGTSYIYGSIMVERVSKEDENTVEVKGSHSFKGIIKNFEQRDFVATIRDYGDNKYNILFRRRGWVTGQWKDTGNITFLYNPDE